MLGGGVRAVELDQRQVGPGEVVSDAQQRFAGQGGDRVGAAVAEIQGGRVPALAETRVSVKCLGGMLLAERYGRDGVLLQEPRKRRLSPGPNRAVITIPVSSLVGAPIRVRCAVASAWRTRS